MSKYYKNPFIMQKITRFKAEAGESQIIYDRNCLLQAFSVRGRRLAYVFPEYLIEILYIPVAHLL